MVGNLFRRQPGENALQDPSGIILAAILLIILCTGCAPSAGISRSASGLDLTDRFFPVAASDRRPEGERAFARHERVVRNGVARDAMVLVAPVSIRASLDGFSGRAFLEGHSAPVYNVGDGMEMDILLLGHGRESVIYSRYYDAGRRLEDRAWIPIDIPLDLEEWSRDAQLEIRVSGGPQGDLVADWLALSAIRIVRKDAAR